MEQFDERTLASGLVPHRVREWIPCIAATIVGCAAGVTLLALRAANHGPEPANLNWWLVAWFTTGSTYLVAGTTVAMRPARRKLGLLFLVVGLAALLTAVSSQYLGYESGNEREPAWPALADAADWSAPLAGLVLVALVPWQLLPAGWRADRRGRAVRIAAVVGIAVVVAARVDRHSSLTARRSGVDIIATWSVAVAATVATALVVARWWRLRRTSADPLTAWLAAGMVVAWLGVVPDHVDIADWGLPGANVVSALLLLATVPLLAAGVLIEIVRQSRPSVELNSHRVVEWVILSAGIAVLYTGVVAGFGSLVGSNGPTWLLVAATGVIALGMEPARMRVRRLVDRLVYGARDDPLAVVQGVVDHVGTNTGDELLPALVASLERELRLDAVAIDIAAPGGWERAASVGPPTAHHHEVLLRSGDEVVGRLVVGWADGPSMRTRDEHLLQQLAGPLSLAVSWVRLAADLRRSGAATVSAREEERRRLRRDLHDGLGPSLTGVSLGLRTAVRQLDRTNGADAFASTRLLLERLADEIDSVVVEVKRIVRDLRPTTLDQLGLVGAIAEFTRKFDDDLEIHLALPSGAAPLPAAVEVAAYRTVTEALTNVVRHSRAGRCWLTIATGATVEIDVIDDGIGMARDTVDGVGLTAMRERASELGGAVRFVPHHPHGTHLHVRLPAVLP